MTGFDVAVGILHSNCVSFKCTVRIGGGVDDSVAGCLVIVGSFVIGSSAIAMTIGEVGYALGVEVMSVMSGNGNVTALEVSMVVVVDLGDAVSIFHIDV